MSRFDWALHAGHGGLTPPILKTFGERLLASGHAPKAVIGAAMRRRVLLIHGIVRSGGPLQDRDEG
ncbi:hypothetical protein [Niveibacterium terrae]|uniref:hypothetical protein n=1 Tax=Niveibacterium terrae TaxID=3373598 RepID=UPI003A902AC2